MLEGQREDRLDARGAVREDADGAGRRDGGTRGVAQRRAILIDAVLEIRESAAHLGQLVRCVGRPLANARHHLLAEGDGLIAVVAHAEFEEHLRPAHHAQPDAAVGMHLLGDDRQREGIDIDHVVEEARRHAGDALHLRPVDHAVVNEEAQVDRAKVAGVIRTQLLLTTRVGCFEWLDLRRGVGGRAVGAVKEDEAWVAGGPGGGDDAIHHRRGREGSWSPSAYADRRDRTPRRRRARACTRR